MHDPVLGPDANQIHIPQGMIEEIKKVYEYLKDKDGYMAKSNWEPGLGIGHEICVAVDAVDMRQEQNLIECLESVIPFFNPWFVME